MSGRRRRALLPLMALVLTVLLVAAPPSWGGPGRATPSTGARFSTDSSLYGNATNITYNASTDGFPLSYLEILPVHYNASVSYPLLVFLHGEGKSANWVPGGAGNGLSTYKTQTGLTGATLRGIVHNATLTGFILMAPSPRSSDGFYVNSPCGGPQENDTFDAIAHEQSLHPISAVYLLGFSMGSLGAIALAGHHKGTFAGMALAGTATDTFELLAHRPGRTTGLLGLTCYARPSPTNATALAVFEYLSVMRFHPTNFSGIRIWVSAGGLDTGAPNNASMWPYEHVNNTFLNSTCNVATNYSEPANCTTPFLQVRIGHWSQYIFRFLYEPLGVHVIAQLAPHDLMAFLLGRENGGCFTSTYPPTTFTKTSACP